MRCWISGRLLTCAIQALRRALTASQAISVSSRRFHQQKSGKTVHSEGWNAHWSGTRSIGPSHASPPQCPRLTQLPNVGLRMQVGWWLKA